MAICLRVCLLLLSILVLSACGSEDMPNPQQRDASRSDVQQPDTSTPTNPPVENPLPDGETPTDPEEETPVPGEEEPPEEEEPPVETPEEPAPSRLDTNVFFPVIPGMALYFDNNPAPTRLGAAVQMDSDTVWPLEHEDVLRNYFTSTADAVGLKGIQVLMTNQNGPVYLNVVFANSRPILGNANTYDTRGTTRVRITGVPAMFSIPVRLTASLGGNEWIAIPGMDSQPARRIHVRLRLSLNLLQQATILAACPPCLWYALQSVNFDLWLVPGIGVVGARAGDLETHVQAVTSAPEPTVFRTLRNGNPAEIAHESLTVDGMPVTDPGWIPTIHYGTAAENWLAVQFDGTGSYRARITRTDLPRGIEAATVRFQRGDEIEDVTVSLMVE